MKSKKLQFIVFCLVALSVLLASGAARADQWNKATKVTFREPVEVPGMALPAGTYWFTLADSIANRRIVQIWNEDRTHLFTTILAIPNYRLEPTGHTVIDLDERPSGSPEAIQAWFYPGDNFGQEFVYPKARATELAEEVSRPVLSMRNEHASAPAAVLEQTPVKAVEPTGEEVESTEIVMTEAAIPVAVDSLPKTASSLPLFGLLGLLALCGGLTLRGVVARNMA